MEKTSTPDERAYVTKGCAVCAHPQREDIDHNMALGGKSVRYIAECFRNLSRAQLRRHWKRCQLHPRVRKAFFRKLVAEAPSGASLEGEKAEDIASA